MKIFKIIVLCLVCFLIGLEIKIQQGGYLHFGSDKDYEGNYCKISGWGLKADVIYDMPDESELNGWEFGIDKNWWALKIFKKEQNFFQKKP